MKKVLGLTAAAVAALGSTVVSAETEGNWMMRIRVANVQPEKKSDAVVAAGLASDDIYLKNKTIPEVDFTYFFTKNLAAELILTYPQKMDVHVGALGTKGTVDVLPPTLTLQYHFMPDAQFRPYVGAGINYTNISSIRLGPLDAVTQTLPVGTGNPGVNTVDKSSWGGALQVGCDFKIDTNSYINLDYKKLYVKTDLKNSALGKLSTLTVNPQVVSIGYGFKF